MPVLVNIKTGGPNDTYTNSLESVSEACLVYTAKGRVRQSHVLPRIPNTSKKDWHAVDRPKYTKYTVNRKAGNMRLQMCRLWLQM